MTASSPQLAALCWQPGNRLTAIYQDGKTLQCGTRHMLRQLFGNQALARLKELRHSLSHQDKAVLEHQGPDRHLWLVASRDGEEVRMQLLEGQPSRDSTLLHLVEDLGIGYWHWHLPTDHFFWSPQVFRIFGLPRSHPTSLEDSLSRFHCDDQPKLRALINEALQAPTRKRHLGSILRADGQWRQISVLGISSGKAGAVTDLFGVVQDVTEQQQSQAQIERLAMVAAQGGIGAFICNAEGHIAWGNPACERLLGYKLDEIKGKSPATMLGNACPEAAGAIRRAMTRGQRFEGDLHYPQGAGCPWLHLNITPLYHQLSHDGFIGILDDISERKASEESLKLYQAAFDQVEVGMLILAKDNRIHEANPAACRLLAEPGQALKGRQFPGGFFLASPQPRSGESSQELKLAADPERSIFVLRSPVQGPDAIPYQLVMLRETTASRRANRLLQSNQKMETLGQLVSGLAHDFNNIIGIIQGNLELLDLQLEAEHKGHKAIGNALKAAQRASAITRRLSQFSRQEPVANQPVAAHQALLDAEELLSASLGKDIHLEVELDTCSGTVRVDKGDFVDALLNLAFNARDALGQEGTIRLSCRPVLLGSKIPGLDTETRPGPYTEFVVADNGCGIAPELHDKVLEPFFTTKTRGKGTGLGLSMVYGFVKRSKGYLALRSAPGQGTAVHIWLPQASQDNPLEPVLAEGDSAVLTGKKLLLVDDEKDLLAVMAALLSRLGMVVTSFDNPFDAKAALGGDFDLLLCDVEMPGMTGFDLAEAFAGRQGKPVLLVSGQLSQVPQALASLPRLAKPVSRTDLLRALVQLLRPKE
ncbi:PAS domain S-box protein [Gallaecimonas kandeliae]|uniref:PAS domain-containing hybrid sensor histidine kinase/response regulator n=1 Tax=Gallaecimonas kandeliae TaxID=3029055 RepID=UPI00264A2365|nr:PAS domain S-box protein [Gallaecimonas kandeliae]WKE67062.1 PAS domain S-box protein [Gallaecimonas kandeliae]